MRFLEVLCVKFWWYFLVVLILMTFHKGTRFNMVDGKVSATEPSLEQGQGDPYTNYLFNPRITFIGKFQADVPTINNDVKNFDTRDFVQYDSLRTGSNFNPRGTGEWDIEASVTQVCYGNGTCVTDDGDPILNANFKVCGNRTLAKIVDLDPQAQYFAKIWGWKLLIGNFFSADFTPIPSQYVWYKMIDDGSRGAVFQSVLTGLTWVNDKTTSPLIEEWKKEMSKSNIHSDKLSIRFNLDMYEMDYGKSAFSYGRITGTIGLIGVKSPPFFTHGRMLHRQSQKVQSAPFTVDKKKRKVYIDFGNSLPTTKNGSFNTKNLQKLYVGVSVDVGASSRISCGSKFFWLGKVEQTSPTWYRNNAGIQRFPLKGSFSTQEFDMIKDSPLALVEVTGNWPSIHCKDILLAEAVDGIDIHPYDDWTMHKEPEETAEVRLFATKFGEPVQNVQVYFEPNDCQVLFYGGQISPTLGVPKIAPAKHVLTDANGIAKFRIQTINLKGPRTDYLDGQLYPYTYSIDNKNFSSMCNDKELNNILNHLIVIAIWDKYGPVAEPTWLDNVYPIFKQYANLYPIMTDYVVDLGNYFEVVDRKTTIIITMELPISHPNYMPVTRDLSPSKRKVILDWLKMDKPPIGEPKDFYTVENLRRDLQTALQVELATIPLYLTALASIKYNYNDEVQNILFFISTQEMMHMNLVANILNAIGGRPRLYTKDVAPRYPSRLPGGVHPDLVVPLEKVSISLIRNVFMEIEQPQVTKQKQSSIDWMLGFVEKLKNNHETCCVNSMNSENVNDPHVDEDYFPCLVPGFKDDSIANFKHRQFGMSRRRKGTRQRGKFEFRKHHNTIGEFYNHILNTLGYLTNCGRNNSIFTGDPRRQVNFSPWPVHGRTFKVSNFTTAVEAIKMIIEQGEGSSPCNPMAWSNETVEDLSHYFLFYSITEKREVRVMNASNKEKMKCGHLGEVSYEEKCNGTYDFTGPQIPFDENGVWPMVPNPSMSKFKKGTKAYKKAEKFNKIYTAMLKSLENVFNGHPESFKDSLGLMFSLKIHLKELIKTPIDPDGDPDIGPNAGPPFDFVSDEIN